MSETFQKIPFLYRMIYIFINRVMNRMRTSDPSEQNMQNDIEMYQTILKMICKKCFQNVDSELQLPNKIFSKDIELENRRIGLPEVIDSVSSFPWKAEKAEVIVKSKRKVLLLLQKIDWSCFCSGGRNVASSPRMWLDISLPSTKHLWTWGDMHSGENTKECKTKIQKKKKIQSLQPNTYGDVETCSQV